MALNGPMLKKRGNHSHAKSNRIEFDCIGIFVRLVRQSNLAMISNVGKQRGIKAGRVHGALRHVISE